MLMWSNTGSACCVCALLDAPAAKSLLECNGGEALSNSIKCLLANEDVEYASTLLDLVHTLVESGEEVGSREWCMYVGLL